MATTVSGCVKQSVWSLACWSYSSACSSELRLVHTASQPSSISRVYTVFYWLTAPSRAKDASFIINSCKPLLILNDACSNQWTETQFEVLYSCSDVHVQTRAQTRRRRATVRGQQPWRRIIAVGCDLPTARPDWIPSSGLCLAYGST